MAIVFYVESNHFANFLKNKIALEIAPRLGFELDFSKLSLNVFPPGIAMVNPEVKIIKENNSLGLPLNTILKAQKLGITFQMLQALGGSVIVDRIFLEGGNIQLDLRSVTKTKTDIESDNEIDFLISMLSKPIKVQLDKNISLVVRQIEMKDSAIDLQLPVKNDFGRIKIENIRFFAMRPEGRFYSGIFDLENCFLILNKKQQVIEAFKANIEVRKTAIKVNSLDIQKGLTVAHMEGVLNGSLKNFKKMKSEIRAIVRSETAAIQEYIPEVKGITGNWFAELKILGELENPELNGKLGIDKFSYGLWNLDSIALVGKYKANQLELSSATVLKDDGKVTLDPVAINVQNENFNQNLTLHFTDFDFQKFAGDLKKDISNLNIIFNGKVEINLLLQKIKNKFNLQVAHLKPNLDVHYFELSNQKYLIAREKKIILSLRDFNLNGAITLNKESIDIDSLNFILRSGNMKSFGKIIPGKDVNIQIASNKIDFQKELEKIVGIPVSGTGSVKAEIKGDPKKLQMNFDLDADSFKFINLNIGKVAGRFSLDDDKSILSFNKVQAMKGDGKYIINGNLSVGSDDYLNFDVNFNQLQCKELLGIFQKQLSDISWIPWDVIGSASGTAKITGGYNDIQNRLMVDGQLSGVRWAYLGELVHNIKADFSFHKGTYSATNIVARKYNSTIGGEITYSKDHQLSYKANLTKGKLRDFDYLSSKDFPVDAIVDIKSAGKGPVTGLESETEIDITNAHVRSHPMEPVHFRMETKNNIYKVRGSLGIDQITLDMNVDTKRLGTSSMKVKIPGKDLSSILCFLNYKHCAINDVMFTINSELNLNWPSTNWEMATGEANINQLLLQKQNFKIILAQPTQFTAQAGKFSLNKLQLVGKDTSLALFGSGRLSGNSLNLHLKGDISQKIIEFLTALIEESDGKIIFDTDITGSWGEPNFIGQMQLENGKLRFHGLDTIADSMNGQIVFNGPRARIKDLRGIFGGGDLQLSGYGDFYFNRAPNLNYAAIIKNTRMSIYPFSSIDLTDGKLNMVGDAPPYQLNGVGKIRKASIRKNFQLDQQKNKLRTARYLPAIVRGEKGLYQIHIQVSADNSIFVDNDLFDAEFKGNLLILNNFEHPKIVGEAELVKGKLMFRNTPFQLDQADIKVLNPDNFNPEFSLGGTTDVDNHRISIFGSGTVDDPKISLVSVPPLPQEDILSLLVFGFSGEETKRVSGEDINAITYTEVSSILFEQFKISKDLQSKGVKLRVAPAVNETEETVVHPRRSDTASPKVIVQTQVIKNLDASLGATVGSAQGQVIDGNVEYHLKRGVSVQGVFEQKQGTDQQGVDQKSSIDTSFGGDLKFHWDFK